MSSTEPSNPFAPPTYRPAGPAHPAPGPTAPSGERAYGPNTPGGGSPWPVRAPEQVGAPERYAGRPGGPPAGGPPDGRDGRDRDDHDDHHARRYGMAPALDSWGRPVPERKERRGLSAVWIVPLVLLSLVAGGVGGWGAQELLDDSRPADAALPVPVSQDGPRELTGVASIAEQVLPSVVSIEVRGAAGEGTGSGFVLREDGYILTNNHVIAAAADTGGEISVLFADGQQEPAELVGRTAGYDLAVIKVARDGLRPLVLGDSEAVAVGDPVVAVGAPLGLQGTVTTGIVSAKNRPVSAGDFDATTFINAIQTDAAINPGNSGGPLVNVAGEVVGINSAIAQPPGAAGGSAGSIGLGFAIPSNQARRTAEQLIETGTATYPVIGVLLDRRYTGEGVQVSTQSQEGTPPVTPGGPADRAGIVPGDVIVAIDGRPVTEDDELIVAIRARAPGDAVTLTVRSEDGQERDVRVVLDETTSE